MKIRSITYFCNPHWPLDDGVLQAACAFNKAAQKGFEAAGYEVQTSRLATIPFPRLVLPLDEQEAVSFARQLEAAAEAQGYAYISLGPALVDFPESYALIPKILAATRNVFLSGEMTNERGDISMSAVRDCARVIERTALIRPDGFANLNFAALANVPAGSPFFPAAYHDAEFPAFALATEAADLAVEAFERAGSLAGARQNLKDSLEENACVLEKTARELADSFNIQFRGIDFSLAPFPENKRSLGAAIERLGVSSTGRHGSLAAAAILAETVDRAEFQHVGFSGLLFPVLEDAVLAERAAQGLLSVKDLLLFSAVCGTGLDTVPLPRDTTGEQIYTVLLDLAVLAMRLQKPLTARLMPIPGKKAGDPIHFDFAYFSDSRVMALDALPLTGPLSREETFQITGRRPIK